MLTDITYMNDYVHPRFIIDRGRQIIVCMYCDAEQTFMSNANNEQFNHRSRCEYAIYLSDAVKRNNRMAI